MGFVGQRLGLLCSYWEEGWIERKQIRQEGWKQNVEALNASSFSKAMPEGNTVMIVVSAFSFKLTF